MAVLNSETFEEEAVGNYNGGNIFSGPQQKVSGRCQVVSSPVRTGTRALRCQVQDGDDNVSGSGTGERCEVCCGATGLTNATPDGLVRWFAFSVQFPTAYTASSGDWNYFWQLHQSGGTPFAAAQVPQAFVVNAGVNLKTILYGGNQSSGSRQDIILVPNFQRNVWYDFEVGIRFAANSTGWIEIWVNGSQVVPQTFRPTRYTATGCYMKAGIYRNGTSNTSTSTIYHDRFIIGETRSDVTLYGDEEPPPAGDEEPDANTRDRRFGKITVGVGRNGLSDGFKAGSKFATGLALDEEGDLHDFHFWNEGFSGSGTQKATLGVYADDGGSGLPGTKFGECDVELSRAGDAAAEWTKLTCASPIRITGANAWLVVGQGATTNTLRYATDGVTNGLVFAADAYDVSAPRLSDPFGTATSANIEMSICADYDVVEGSSGGGGDTTPPALTSAVVIAADTLLVEYDEPLDTTVEPLPADYTVFVDSVLQTPTAVDVTGSVVQLSLSSPVAPLADVVLTYARVAGRELRDLAGNFAGNLSQQPVENDTLPPQPSSSRSITTARSTSVARTSNPDARMADRGGGGI